MVKYGGLGRKQLNSRLEVSRPNLEPWPAILRGDAHRALGLQFWLDGWSSYDGVSSLEDAQRAMDYVCILRFEI